MPKMVTEKPPVLSRIAADTKLPVDEVTRLVAACRDAVDELIADDWSIVAPPLIYATADDIVFKAFKDKLKTCADEEARTCLDWEQETFASWLGVSIEQLHRHPIANDNMVFIRVMQRLGLAIDDVEDWSPSVRAKGEQLLLVLDAWLDSFADRRPYLIGHAGLEKDFENWLVDHLDRLAGHDFPVRLHGRQTRLDGGRLVPDLVCRFTATAAGGARKRDWLVIENKAGAGYIEAGDQVAAYADRVRIELAQPGEQVFALLIADGASPRVREHLDELNISYLSLASLDYRRRNWPPTVSSANADLERLSAPSTPSVPRRAQAEASTEAF